MRVALFGGTFDPPHLGHLRIATAAADRFALDRVFFAPTGRQPLKSAAPIASFPDRLAMAELACATDFRFTAIDLDAPRLGGPNYTVDSLSALSYLHPEAELFNIVGADTFLTLPRWRNPARLLDLAEWIVVSRPRAALGDDQPSATIAAAIGRKPTPQEIARVHLLTGIAELISATDIRTHLLAGDDVSAHLLPSIGQYIARHSLYR